MPRGPPARLRGVGAEAEASSITQPSGLRLLRSRGRARGIVALLGPAFVAAVAYVDPGNFATNISAGRCSATRSPAWTVVVANLMAMLVQYLSAKTGVATGRDLPELCREHFGRRRVPGPVGAGGAHRHGHRPGRVRRRGVGLNLLFRVPLLPAGLITAVVAFGILALEQRGYRRFELAIAALLGIVLLGFAYDLAAVDGSPRGHRGWAGPGLASDRLLLVPGSSGRRSCRTSSTCIPR